MEGMRTWRDSKGCRWTCRCRKNKTKMEMKIEFSRIERWEVIGECVSVYHQDCWVDFFTGTRDGQKLTSTCNFANFSTISSFEAAPYCEAARQGYHVLLSQQYLNIPVPKMGHAPKTKKCIWFLVGFAFFNFLTHDTV